MTDIKRVGSSGVHTVEGTVAGRRAAELTKEREAQRAEYEALKNKIKAENAGGLARIDDKFSQVDTTSYATLPSGLITAAEIRLERERGAQQGLVQQQQEAQRKQLLEAQQAEKKKAERLDKRKKLSAALSFCPDEDEDGGGGGDEADRESQAPSSSGTGSSSSSSSGSGSGSSSSNCSSSGGGGAKKPRIHKDPTAEASPLSRFLPRPFHPPQRPHIPI